MQIKSINSKAILKNDSSVKWYTFEHILTLIVALNRFLEFTYIHISLYSEIVFCSVSRDTATGLSTTISMPSDKSLKSPAKRILESTERYT